MKRIKSLQEASLADLAENQMYWLRMIGRCHYTCSDYSAIEECKRLAEEIERRAAILKDNAPDPNLVHGIKIPKPTQKPKTEPFGMKRCEECNALYVKKLNKLCVACRRKKRIGDRYKLLT